ncbi:hypothetical protein ILYODFUR_028879, partial [Ilyodon furcidens]
SSSEEDTRDAKSCDLEEVFDSDKLIIGRVCNIPKEAASSIPTVEGQSLSCDIPSISTGDDVVWCVATQDICTGALSSDTLTMSTSATVITIDDNLSLSGRTSVTSSGHSQAPSSCCLISADNDRLSAVSNGLPQHSIPENSSSITPYSDRKIPVERIVEQIASCVNDEGTVRFNIVRRNVWDGASRAMDRSNFAPEKKVDVKFTDDYGISEGAVDNGGPAREFFRLCLHEIKDRIGIFEGPSNSKILTCNSKAMKDNGYYYAGQIMAMSIGHGGHSPCFLSGLLYDCLHKGPDNIKVALEDIPDEDIKSKVMDILQADTELKLQDAVMQAASLISLAGHSVRITLANKQETAFDLAHWYVLQRTRPPFEKYDVYTHTT